MRVDATKRSNDGDERLAATITVAHVLAHISGRCPPGSFQRAIQRQSCVIVHPFFHFIRHDPNLAFYPNSSEVGVSGHIGTGGGARAAELIKRVAKAGIPHPVWFVPVRHDASAPAPDANVGYVHPRYALLRRLDFPIHYPAIASANARVPDGS